MRRFGRSSAVIVGVLSILLHLRLAVAEEDAEALIRQGNQLRQRGDNERAHGYFKRAYELAHIGRTAAQLGLVEMAIQHFLDAEIHLTEALASNDAWVEKNRTLLEETRDRGRGHLGRVEIHGAPAGTTVKVEGRAAIPVPSDGILWAPPGRTTLTFPAASGHDVTKEALVSKDGTVSIELALAPVATIPAKDESVPIRETASNGAGNSERSGSSHGDTAGGPGPAVPDLRLPQPTDAASSHRTLRIVGIATAGAGVASAVAGVLLYHSGNSKLDAILMDAAANRPFNESNNDYKTLQRAGVTCMVLGGTAVAAGVLIYILNRDSQPESPRVNVSFAYGAGGGGIQISGRLP